MLRQCLSKSLSLTILIKKKNVLSNSIFFYILKRKKYIKAVKYFCFMKDVVTIQFIFKPGEDKALGRPESNLSVSNGGL